MNDPGAAKISSLKVEDMQQRQTADSVLLDDRTANNIDQQFRAALAELTRGMSLTELALAYLDWLGHLTLSPGKRLQLTESLIRKMLQLGAYNMRALLGQQDDGPAKSSHRRVSGEAWQQWPFNAIAQSWLVTREWWQEATTGVVGVGKEHGLLVAYMAEQILEAVSPANFPLTNPEIHKAAKQEQGRNFLRGIEHLIDDYIRQSTGEPQPGTERFRVGKDVAITEGKVIYQNDLMELIQYKPATAKVGVEPILIVPAWIMKYYILDLSPKNSMVKYLLEQGKTVFMISWKNPTEEDRGTTMDDYRNLGIMAALDAVNAVVPGRKINAVGYCIGGSLLYIAAAAMARDDDNRLQSIAIFASQADFSEAGEIRRFLGESIFASLHALMQKQGYLGVENMGGAFQALRSADLIWGPAVDRYLLGKESSLNDLMSWNADGTRMPYTMHSEYLRKLYMDNDLAEGRYTVDGKPISVSDINVPLFVVGTVTDHVAPWKSVYKIHGLNQTTEVTFLLTTGGHNAGIISGPSHPRRSYQMHTRKSGDKHIDPDTWFETFERHPGSWWPAFSEWLDSQMSGTAKPPAMGAQRKGYKALRDAPGEYVLQR
ncbi:MAG: PHA/PHB synthase family protein [Pseudomonadales bacterium]